METLEELKRNADQLADKAERAQGDKADKLFEKAGQIYQAALAIDPEYIPALNAWGAALIAQAQMKSAGEAIAFFDLAVDKLHQAEVISPGSGSYNLACIAALRGRVEECRKWLENGPSHGKIPRRNHLENDPDLSAVRTQSWFQTFLEKVGD
jgi:tetratricopeptide (TPR) repeat protein